MSKFNYKKKYGQNFLQDDKIILNIVNSINPSVNDLVIEIGPGSGALTKYLVKNSPLLCYEIDIEVKEYLEKYNNDNLSIIFDDFLKRNIKEDIKDYKYNNLYIIGNLPYYITTPIITKIIEEELNVEEMVFMVQKEVAERLSAKPGSKDYGSISVYLNYYFDVKKLFVVNKNKFEPIPKVDSAVIKFIKKEQRKPVDLNIFNKIVKDAFHMKRKNLRNNLREYNLRKIEEILNELGYSLNNRAEDLPYEVYVELANKY